MKITSLISFDFPLRIWNDFCTRASSEFRRLTRRKKNGKKNEENLHFSSSVRRKRQAWIFLLPEFACSENKNIFFTKIKWKEKKKEKGGGSKNKTDPIRFHFPKFFFLFFFPTFFFKKNKNKILLNKRKIFLIQVSWCSNFYSFADTDWSTKLMKKGIFGRKLRTPEKSQKMLLKKVCDKRMQHGWPQYSSCFQCHLRYLIIVQINLSRRLRRLRSWRWQKWPLNVIYGF